MEPAVRPATAADVPAVLALWRDAGAEPSRTDDERSVVQLIAHDPAALLLAVDGARIVGSAIAGWDGWRGSIYRLVVAPDRRRHGLGRHLLAAAGQRLQELGAARMQAIVVASDGPAAAFWRGSGWEEQTERLRFVTE